MSNGAVVLGRDLRIRIDRAHHDNLRALAKREGVESIHEAASNLLSFAIDRAVEEILMTEARAAEIGSIMSGISRPWMPLLVVGALCRALMGP